jgi:hypothetical protein
MTRLIYRRFFVWSGLIILALLAGRVGHAEPSAGANAPNWPAAPGVAITTTGNSPFGAQLPAMDAARDESELMILYEKRQDNTPEGVPDIWFSRSTNDGGNWSAPQAVFESPGIASVQADFTYDTANLPHAVWVEGTSPAEIVYSRRSGATWPASVLESWGATIVDSPRIAASGANTLDIVWAGFDPPMDANLDIYHVRSINGGANWTLPERTAPSDPPSNAPDIAVGGDGKLHLVWEEEAAGGDMDIYYSQGSPSGNDVNWTEPVNLTSGQGLDVARVPTIAVTGQSLWVAFTHFASSDQQWVYYTSCSASCINAGAWLPPLLAQSQPVGANTTDPALVGVDLAARGQCIYGYYHGTELGGLNPNSEITWGTNSCDGWAGSARDQVTTGTARAIYPAIEAATDFLHLAYQRIAGGAGRQIYYMRGDLPEPSGGIYLPIVRR